MSPSWVVSRLGRSLVTLWLLMSFTFVALTLSADPALQILGPEADEEALAAFRQAWGLDQPLWRQYLQHLGRIAAFDFGLSYRTAEPAIEMVMARLPASLSLMIPTGLLAVAVGVPLGVLAAIRRNTLIDRGAMMFAILGFAVPNFLVGILLIYAFSVWLGWLQPSGIVDWRSWIMPVITMASAEAAIFARFARTSMAEVLGHPMMRTALANGIPWRQAVREHALPNAAIPIVTMIGLVFGGLIASGVITENVFSWPGIGRFLVDSVAARDFAVVQTIVLLVGVTMILANLIVDLAYGWIDPRVRDSRR
ncbi:ABC transporter permease [Algihabitans albus]|uniref:ABC transporter permease n=1 Tax=Algihabitans albus TaxID=2164067 RepID=UPI001F31B80B|nr:ABC transporter permease [Algihabitans albus]